MHAKGLVSQLGEHDKEGMGKPRRHVVWEACLSSIRVCVSLLCLVDAKRHFCQTFGRDGSAELVCPLCLSE
jgi:hypothetical protein